MRKLISETKNWDDEGNWIGDNVPDSTRDWSVKNQETVGPVEMTGIMIGLTLRLIILVYKIVIFAAPIALVVLFILWATGLI